LERLAKEFGFEAFFPLVHRRELSVDVAVGDMRGAEFVLADLSRERPSCYFELGLAEALGLKVVLMAVKGTPIHQVGKATNVWFYSNPTEYVSAVCQALARYSNALTGTRV
jgi:nucleoside 2-deoxyribosyltransferase